METKPKLILWMTMWKWDYNFAIFRIIAGCGSVINVGIGESDGEMESSTLQGMKLMFVNLAQILGLAILDLI